MKPCRRDEEVVGITCIGMGTEDGTGLLGTVADEGDLSPIQIGVVDAGGDDVGVDGFQHVCGRGIDGSVALHTARVNHGTHEAGVIWVECVILCSHALQGGHRKQGDAEGVADAFGSADTNTEDCVAARPGGDAYSVELRGLHTAVVEQLLDVGRELGGVGIGLGGVQFGTDARFVGKSDGTNGCGGFD